MRAVEADTVIVGSGVSGVLVARALLAAGERCAIVDRGSFLTWEQMNEKEDHESGRPTTKNNHQNVGGLDWPWAYVYGVGGSTLHWRGHTPRFLPDDFELGSRYGVARDWPISYDDLLPDYRRAERLMGIAGAENELMPGSDFPLPPHPLSPMDRILKPHLEPFIAMPQARPTEPFKDRPACCGSATCSLCPIDSKFTVLNTFGDVLEHPRVELLPETIAARLASSRDGRAIESVECVNGRREEVSVRGKRFVVAANGIESPGLLLRSGLDHGDTGLYLFDHPASRIILEGNRPLHPGEGNSIYTGSSYTYYSGEFRSKRAGILLYPYNPGVFNMQPMLVDALVRGKTGKELRDDVVGRWQRQIRISVEVEDLPNRANRVALSAKKDRFGLPLNATTFNRQSDYHQRAMRNLEEDLPRRLRPVGIRSARLEDPVLGGGHLCGTCRMGTDDRAVVEPDFRHKRRDNLFVVGSSLFPTPSPSHPTLTIAALAVRAGRTLAGET